MADNHLENKKAGGFSADQCFARLSLKLIQRLNHAMLHGSNVVAIVTTAWDLAVLPLIRDYICREGQGSGRLPLKIYDRMADSNVAEQLNERSTNVFVNGRNSVLNETECV